MNLEEFKIQLKNINNEIKDFKIMQKILRNIEKRKPTEIEHNKMLSFAIKYPNSANVAVYFDHIKNMKKL